ncbi:exodeoxyribonuclease VII small subunit [Gracilibacillus halophilus YIM-C55.5]|uniref:Exodeoxyribonuclease 7 small subunit n=1 Tax=Gracilibacillus halophilus YIM-C55.5 TaxID=1308866 RepID=N4WAW0_9BACI|nr:exodeoxyribonuclease VII small subunit [Gracilibacillus halophilus]ENH97428.1 exodeoxyribonuclease VII small subunit [Gracilibacillus halophilus YIM-C55.5]
MTENKDELSFEQALEKLENIVQKMEEGDVPLEDAMKYYEEGSKLSKICHEKLVTAEKQIQEIVDDNGELKTFDLQEEE